MYGILYSQTLFSYGDPYCGSKVSIEGREGGGYRILQESRGGGLLQYFSGVLWTKRKRLVCRVFRSMHPSGDFRAAQRYVDPYSGFCWYMQLFCFGNLQLYKVILIENSAKRSKYWSHWMACACVCCRDAVNTCHPFDHRNATKDKRSLKVNREWKLSKISFGCTKDSYTLPVDICRVNNECSSLDLSLTHDRLELLGVKWSLLFFLFLC